MPLFSSISFEVFGKVQGVFFRKYTMKKATELRLVGWVKNTKSGTVVGEAEGTAKAVDDMVHWLGHVGSPHSKIERCEIKGRKDNLSSLRFPDFKVIRDPDE